MIDIDLPTNYPTYLFFSFYGTAFLILSFTIGTKNMTGSNLRIADSLWLLAMFGLTHGAEEWFRIYELVERENFSPQMVRYMDSIPDFVMIVSYLFLLHFGLYLCSENKQKRLKLTVGAHAILWSIFIFSVIPEMKRNDFQMTPQLWRHVEVVTRNSFGLVSGLITAYGLIRYSREIKPLSVSIARTLYEAGAIFALFGIFTTAIFSIFTSGVLGVSSDIFRGIAAIFITYLIIRALNIFDIETRGRIVDQERHLAQTEKLVSLGQLAAGIAHEMNNPLTNASLGVQMLKKKMGSGGEQGVLDRLNAVEKNIDRAAMIAQELLQFSRNREMDLIRLDINRVIISALSLMKFKLNNIDIEQSLAQVPPVMGDSMRLQQVIINVLSNAVEAMPTGGRIRISASSLGNGMVEVRITDTGSGITEEQISRVFEPFYTTKEVGTGTGLGLSISYGIIKQHHGDIKISSTVGKGTTVTIEIPEA